ncbi:rhodanese-like domain-containing protein [Ponticoccus sp. SC2-23]|uniref:rhodanese-like domain-containing protein n=1 Tax=Alexandriicola marinus TaxID=2081710 RepID=UPI000FDC82FB|nr:rhodanese-like domain-containing protein [Alexandriicola marinus]MBM1220212.1 rhodanese-like domain-containing protein [Ponticoccus sp. SC6-9]MBM1224898.1 rhodanese-like domain-containing protein [Ponticoccus sp. SC6-15]MBM1228412.1 rhodanese-like domain-containing protein [Ponticoccus sp. SC6-38]MBM1233951.1 rhodanese-like domain-containing protein [Ponticoccus sp. SC6-45]MBM1238913.1 rhodanese-like domain-containing protein [Ponticoccus sp. SC6-49]MBM1242695.1 rhodanese-like domain-conta
MKTFATSILVLGLTGAAQAEDVNITRDMASAVVQTPSGEVEISRIQDQDAVIEGEFARIARPCPNFCIQPMVPAEGVTPVGELEVIAALQDPETLVIDGRVRPEFEAGTIPGAISVPYNEAADRLGELGCEIDFDGWICEGALPQVVLFCNGPWCGQSPTAARNMIEAGFPAENISYYRGGMQSWQMLGLTITGGE